MDGCRLPLVNVSAGELCLERRWPPTRFARLIGLFAACEGVKVVLVGAPSEAEYVEGVRALVEEDVREQVVNTAGEVSYGEFLALLEAADVLLTGDTGPMHLAGALGTPTVSLWGPTLPRVYQPPGPDHRGIHHGAYCSPCIGWVPSPPCAGEMAPGVDEELDDGSLRDYLEGHVAWSHSAAGHTFRTDAELAVVTLLEMGPRAFLVRGSVLELDGRPVAAEAGEWKVGERR